MKKEKEPNAVTVEHNDHYDENGTSENISIQISSSILAVVTCRKMNEILASHGRLLLQSINKKKGI